MQRVLGMAPLVAVSLVNAAPAEAHVKRFRSSITADTPSDADDFVIVTIGGKPKCIPNRTVHIIDATGAIIGTGGNTTTPGTKVSAPIVVGEEYRALIPKKVIKKKRGHKHVCKRATSPTVTAVA
jgi:hypothetical protein